MGNLPIYYIWGVFAGRRRQLEKINFFDGKSKCCGNAGFVPVTHQSTKTTTKKGILRHKALKQSLLQCKVFCAVPVRFLCGFIDVRLCKNSASLC